MPFLPLVCPWFAKVFADKRKNGRWWAKIISGVWKPGDMTCAAKTLYAAKRLAD
jgi:hypothetical protein